MVIFTMEELNLTFSFFSNISVGARECLKLYFCFQNQVLAYRSNLTYLQRSRSSKFLISLWWVDRELLNDLLKKSNCHNNPLSTDERDIQCFYFSVALSILKLYFKKTNYVCKHIHYICIDHDCSLSKLKNDKYRFNHPSSVSYCRPGSLIFYFLFRQPAGNPGSEKNKHFAGLKSSKLI